MKVKTLIACAATAVALPLAAHAQNATPSGPQGTGWYGSLDPLDIDRNGVISAEERAPAGATYERSADGVISRGEQASAGDTRAEGRAYSGPSWATNPPVPAP